MAISAAPQLEGDARAAMLHRGSHLQIIASAGFGKTEVVAQLMADGADPAGIIAFTFTERAADELKARTSARVEERLGPPRSTSWARHSWGRSTPTIAASEQTVEASVTELRQRIFHARPRPRCRRYDVHNLCRWSGVH